MKLLSTRVAFLVLGTSALSACSLLFADASTLPAPGGLGDGSVSGADGSAGDAGPVPSVVDCDKPPGCGGVGVTKHDFKRSVVAATGNITNVALVFDLETKKFCGAVQGPLGNSDGQTNSVFWSEETRPGDGAFDTTPLCSNNAACLGTLHLSAWRAPLAILSEGTCAAGSRQAHELLTGTKYCLGSGLNIPSIDLWGALKGENSSLGAYIVADVGGGRATSTSTSTSTLTADGALGIWGGVVSDQFYSVFNGADTLYRADSARLGTPGNEETPATSLTTLGAAISHPDVAVAKVGADEVAFIAGGVATKDATAFTLAARKWADGTTVADAARPLPTPEALGFTKRFVPATPRATVEGEANPEWTGIKGARFMMKPLLVRATSDGLLRLVGLNAVSDDRCALRVAVQKDALRWETRNLEGSLPCNETSFDAALDTNGKLHVLYGQGTATVGYKVVTP